MDWAEVAQKLGFTVDRVRRKWSRIKNTGAVSEPLFAQLPFAQLPLSYGNVGCSGRVPDKSGSTKTKTLRHAAN